MLLGNLTVEQIEKRLNITLSFSDRQRLKNTHQNKASGLIGESWHCFDMPFVMMCSNYSFAKEIYEIFAPYEKNMRTSFQIALEGQFETEEEGEI